MNQPVPKPDETHPNIQEILRKRREMLNRVRADLEKVGRLQQEFQKSGKDSSKGKDPLNGKSPGS